MLDVDPERFQDAPTVDTTEVADTVGQLGPANVREWWQTEVEPMTEKQLSGRLGVGQESRSASA